MIDSNMQYIYKKHMVFDISDSLDAFRQSSNLLLLVNL